MDNIMMVCSKQADYVNAQHKDLSAEPPRVMVATEMATSTIAQSLRRLLPLTKSQLPPALRPQTGNLCQILSRTPTGGVGAEVHQLRWSEKQISDSYWVITRSKFKCGGNHGKAWGQLYWKGVLVSPREELIRGALKYAWKDGRSKAKSKPSQKSPETVTLIKIT